MPSYDDDDVEVLYEMPYSNGNAKGNGKRNRSNRGGRTNGNGGVSFSNVDFENVFDPFERDQDDVREFFDDSEEILDDNNDWEKPTVFSDPRKVRDKYWPSY
jgi:hypothetical protein